MRIPIFTKLFVSLFVTSIVLVASMALSIGYSFKSGFQEYLNQQEREKITQLSSIVSEYYSDQHGWQAVQQDPVIWRDAFEEAGMAFPLPENLGPAGFRRPNLEQFNFDRRLDIDSRSREGERPTFDRRFDEREKPNFDSWPSQDSIRNREELAPISHRIYLADTEHHWVIGSRPIDKDSDLDEWHETPIMQNDALVGWLVFQQKNLLQGPIVTQFYAQQQSNILWFVCLSGLASLLVALFLVRHFLLPLKQLKKGAAALSEGNYDVTFEVKSNDEFSELSDTFQSLVSSLKQQKNSREQWLVDISHELRTPIAVLRSELEAIQDGVRQASDERVDAMHHQVMGLGRLVDDLYLLSKTDSGVYQTDIQTLDLIPLVEMVINQCEHRMEQKGLGFVFNKQATPLLIEGDEKTLGQLLLNLLENSLRYTDAPGDILVSITEEGDDAVLRVEDSAPSVDEEHLPKLFERLYRVDQSRSREHGGSGLGLSIGKNIVVMHGGDIVAEVSALGGLAIEVRLKKSRV